jgi:thiosulfate/3-mercaptopyruvate sulfurtransferase
LGSAKTGSYARPELLADTDWLAERLDDPSIRIIDCRDDPEDYDESHIPGAVYMNYKKTKTKNGGVHILTPEEAAERFGAMGIGDDNEVVVYDDVGSYAGRVWWTLHHYGHERVRILNGGWKKWTAEGRPVTREIPKPAFATFTPRPREDDIATAEEVQREINAPNTQIFDTRSGIEYFGILEKLGYRKRANRGGHVPSARWVDWKWSIKRSDHTMKPANELEQMFRKEGFDPNKNLIVYCQSAARSGHQLFSLKLLGYDKVKNYDGSWKEWGNSETSPIEVIPHIPLDLSAASTRRLLAVLVALMTILYTVKKIGGRLRNRTRRN